MANKYHIAITLGIVAALLDIVVAGRFLYIQSLELEEYGVQPAREVELKPIVPYPALPIITPQSPIKLSHPNEFSYKGIHMGSKIINAGIKCNKSRSILQGDIAKTCKYIKAITDEWWKAYWENSRAWQAYELRNSLVTILNDLASVPTAGP